MSEHGHHEYPAWKSKLAHAFEELKEADASQEARLRANQKELQRLINDVARPVLEQFVRDAPKYGFRVEIGALNNTRQIVTMTGHNNMTINLVFDASPDAVVFTAQRQGTVAVNLLKEKPAPQFQDADFAEFLVSQLEAIKPKHK